MRLLLFLLVMAGQSMASDYDLIGSEPVYTQSPKRQILFFTGDWCGTCRVWKTKQLPRMKSSGWTFGNADDVQTHIREIDDRQRPDLVKRFSIRSFPTFLIVEREEVIERLSGYRTAEQLNTAYTKEKSNEHQPDDTRPVRGRR